MTIEQGTCTHRDAKGPTWAQTATCWRCGVESSVAVPPPGTHLVLMGEDLMMELGATRVDWGEPDEHGWYTPAVYREFSE